MLSSEISYTLPRPRVRGAAFKRGEFKMRGLIFVGALALPAAVLAQATGVMPGQWDIAITTTSMSMPDMPPEVAKSMAGRTIHVRHCITPVEALSGPQTMMRGDKSCTFSKYQMLGNRLHAEVTCKQPQGMMHSVSDGTFSPTGFTTTGKTVMTGNGGMTMTATTVGKRTGACGK